MMRKIRILIGAAGLLLGLQACGTSVLLMAGGGVASVFNDRRHEDVQYLDGEIGKQIQELIAADSGLRHTVRVDVDVYNKVVLLTGEAVSEPARVQAVNLATQVRGIRQIHNEIRLNPLLPQEVQAEDTVLNTQIKLTLASRMGVDATLVQVRSSGRRIYLMGLLSRAEARDVTEIVRRIEGVREVLPLFEYVRLLPTS